MGCTRPVKSTVNEPATGGLVGPITAVQGLPVAGLFVFSVQVNVTPGVASVAFTVSVALVVL